MAETDLDESNPEEIGTFCLQATPQEPRYLDGDSLPSHNLVIRPLLAAAEQARVIGLPHTPEARDLLAEIAVARRGYYELDLNKELLTGHERLWNSSAWARGAIIIVCEPARLELEQILSWCDGPWIWTTLYQLHKSTPRAAVAFAFAQSHLGRIAFLFSASNGAEWMNVFPPRPLLQQTFDLALANCRRFKRFIEHNPGATNEIIVNRPPYTDAV